MLIPGPLNPPAPRYWEHTPSSPGRHGGVVRDDTGSGYVATVRKADAYGRDHLETRFCLSLEEAERWLMQEVNGLPMGVGADTGSDVYAVR